MVIKTKRIPIKDEIAGRNWVEKLENHPAMILLINLN